MIFDLYCCTWTPKHITSIAHPFVCTCVFLLLLLLLLFFAVLLHHFFSRVHVAFPLLFLCTKVPTFFSRKVKMEFIVWGSVSPSPKSFQQHPRLMKPPLVGSQTHMPGVRAPFVVVLKVFVLLPAAQGTRSAHKRKRMSKRCCTQATAIVSVLISLFTPFHFILSSNICDVQ